MWLRRQRDLRRWSRNGRMGSGVSDLLRVRHPGGGLSMSEMAEHSGQYVVVYGPPKEPPTVYATAYRTSERESAHKACAARHPESEHNAVRVVRACDLDPKTVHGPSHL